MLVRRFIPTLWFTTSTWVLQLTGEPSQHCLSVCVCLRVCVSVCMFRFALNTTTDFDAVSCTQIRFDPNFLFVNFIFYLSINIAATLKKLRILSTLSPGPGQIVIAYSLVALKFDL